jgi:SAM-dependent methyltransferase
MNKALLILAEAFTEKSEVENKTILEVGSYNVNGSFRTIFVPKIPKSYIGVDIAMGPGVDKVCAIKDIVTTFGNSSFDIIISTEAIEHIEDWKTAINNLKSVCKVGGTLYLTSRSKGFPYHGYPHDYWRYELSDIRQIFSNWEILVLVSDPQEPGFFLKAVKKSEELIELSEIDLYKIVK